MEKIFSLFVIAFITLISYCYGDYVAMCGSGFPVTGSNINVPSPIVLRKGGKITYSFLLKTTKDITGSIDIKLRLKKKLLFWIPIPCIKNVGSCTYKFTPNLFKIAGLPQAITKGEHMVVNTITIPRNAYIPRILAKGRYRLEATVYESGRQIGCVKAEATVKT